MFHAMHEWLDFKRISFFSTLFIKKNTRIVTGILHNFIHALHKIEQALPNMKMLMFLDFES